MTPRGKIDLQAIRSSLSTTCTECGYSIPPNEVTRIDSERQKCPKCGSAFTPKNKGA